MKDGSVSIVVAVPHHLVLGGVVRLFERCPGFTVLAECGDGQEALRLVEDVSPDVLILDLKVQNPGGLAVLHRLQVTDSDTCVVAVTNSTEQSARASRLGAVAMVGPDHAPRAFLDAARRAHASRSRAREVTLVPAGAAMDSHGAGSSTLVSERKGLTATEMHVTRMVMRGLRNRIIAEHMHISEGTVKVHLHNIYDKLGIDGRLGLVVWAREQNL